MPAAGRQTAATVLRNQGLDEDLSERRLGSLLMLMHRAGVIKYTKQKGQVTVLAQPAQSAEPPASIFISPTTPFGNKVWLRRILEGCEGYVYWLDKHFLPVAFEVLWEAADGNRISEVRILSLNLEQNQGKRATRSYRDLREELRHRSITLEWRTIESRQMKNAHDRWVIGSSSAWNVPDVGTVYSGNYSEMNRSGQQLELKEVFEGYWSKGTPVAIPDG